MQVSPVKQGVNPRLPHLPLEVVGTLVGLGIGEFVGGPLGVGGCDVIGDGGVFVFGAGAVGLGCFRVFLRVFVAVGYMGLDEAQCW